ncbi:glutaminase liver isoform, mitochondrial-like isoform X2 [Rhodnius prolixus]
MRIITQNWYLFFKALTKSMVIPKFEELRHAVGVLYGEIEGDVTGETSNYIPEIKNTCPDLWAVSICSTDGQKCSFGDYLVPLTIQDISYPFLYAKCLDLFGSATVLEYVGIERKPADVSVKNSKANNRAFNPMTDSGAISLSTLFCDNDKRTGTAADKHYEFFEFMKALCGNNHFQICTPAYVSVRQKDDLSRSIAYAMLNQGHLPNDTDIPTIMDFYFEARSLEVTCDGLAVMAATLANFGVNPYTNEKLISPISVKAVLSAMHNWGNYGYSGVNAFYLGLPSKHSVAGAFMVVVPGMLGLILYSPRINDNEVGEKNIDFAMKFVKKFDLHPLSNSSKEMKKRFGTRKIPEVPCENYCKIFTAVFNNDLEEVMNLTKGNKKIVFEKDLEGRTILHLAAIKGHFEIIKFVTSNFRKLSSVKDRFGRVPREYVKASDKNFFEITNIFKKWEDLDKICELASASNIN